MKLMMPTTMAARTVNARPMEAFVMIMPPASVIRATIMTRKTDLESISTWVSLGMRKSCYNVIPKKCEESKTLFFIGNKDFSLCSK